MGLHGLEVRCAAGSLIGLPVTAFPATALRLGRLRPRAPTGLSAGRLPPPLLPAGRLSPPLVPAALIRCFRRGVIPVRCWIGTGGGRPMLTGELGCSVERTRLFCA